MGAIIWSFWKHIVNYSIYYVFGMKPTHINKVCLKLSIFLMHWKTYVMPWSRSWPMILCISIVCNLALWWTAFGSIPTWSLSKQSQNSSEKIWTTPRRSVIVGMCGGKTKTTSQRLWIDLMKWMILSEYVAYHLLKALCHNVVDEWSGFILVTWLQQVCPLSMCLDHIFDCLFS